MVGIAYLVPPGVEDAEEEEEEEEEEEAGQPQK